MTTLNNDELEQQLMQLFQKASAFGYSMSSKISREEFASMDASGQSKDHQRAAHEAMQLIATHDQQLLEAILEGADKLDEWIDYNSHDMGDIGKFIRVEYAHNGVKELCEHIKSVFYKEGE